MIRVIAGLAAIALVATSVSAATAAEPTGVRRFALIVGANDGGPARVRLRYAVTDADSVAGVLDQLGGVADVDQITLTEPTPSQIRAALGLLNQRVRAARAAHKRTEVVFYYSGHADEYGLLLGSESLGYRELRAGIEALSADVRIAIVDSCASGAMLRRKGGQRVAPFLVDDSTDVSGHAYLTSSSANEVAQESDRIGASFFTHHLVSGLRGAADVTGDGRVTLSEAYKFAFDETLARTQDTASGPQHANYDIALSGTGDVVITDVNQMSSKLSLAPTLTGRLFVRDTEGRLVAEVRKVVGRTVSLGLEAGIYRVMTTRDGAVWSALVELGAGQRMTLSDADFIREGDALAFRERGDAPPVDAAPDGGALAEGFVPGEDLRERTSFRWALVPGFGTGGPGEDLLVEGLDMSLIGDHVNSVHGLQTSFVFNSVANEIEGLQMAGVVNVAGHVDGAQLSGALNVAGHVDGAQMSAGLNVAGPVEGAQIGLINIADHVDGLQLGLINVADSVDGVSLGLIPYVADGYNHVEVWGGDLMLWNVGFKIGAPYLYANASIGGSSFSDGSGRPDECVLRIGGGLGSHVALGSRVYLDFDGVASALVGGCNFDFLADDEILTQLKLSVGVVLTPGLALFGGVAANAEVRLTDGGREVDRPLLADVDDRIEPNWNVRFFPSFFAGVRLF